MFPRLYKVRWILALLGITVLVLFLFTSRVQFIPTPQEATRGTFEDGWIYAGVINDQLAVYPPSNASLSLHDYTDGIRKPGWDTDPTDTYNLCLYIGDFTSGRAISSISAIGTLLPPTPAPTQILMTEFMNNFSVWIDDQEISDGRLNSKNTFEMPGFYANTHILCYRYPLEAGTHTGRYQWDSEEIIQQIEWEFSIVAS